MLTPQDGLLSYILPARTAHAGRASASCAKVLACNLLAKMGFAPRKNQTKCFRGEEKPLLKVSYERRDLSIINPSHMAPRLVP
jgi:hypothetical protein